MKQLTEEDARELVREYVDETLHGGFDEEFAEIGSFLKRNSLYPRSRRKRVREAAMVAIVDILLYADNRE